MNTASIAAIPASSGLPMRVNFAWMFAGNAVGAFGQWALVVILARLSDAATLGSYSLALAVASPLFLLLNLQLRSLYATDVAGEYSFHTYFTLRVWTCVLAVITLGISLPFLPSGAAGLLLAVAFMKGFEAVSEIAYASFQRESRMDRIGQSMLLRAGVLLSTVTVILAFSGSVIIAIWAGAAGSMLVSLRDWRNLRAPLRPGFSAFWDWPAMAHLARHSGILSFSLLFVSLNANLPRYHLAHSFGDREVGLFSALAYLAVAGNTLIMAFGQTAVPTLARSFFRRDAKRFLSAAWRLTGLAATTGLGGIVVTIVLGEQLLGLLYGTEYAGQRDAFVWIMSAGAASYLASALGYLLAGARRFHAVVWMLLAATLATASGCWMLIPRHALIGAAVAQLIGSSIQITIGILVLVTTCRRQFQTTAIGCVHNA